MVKSGMRSADLSATEGTYTEYILSQEADEDEVSVMHHDIRGFHDDGERLWVGTKLGISIIDFENDVSTDYELPQGHDLHDMIVLENHVVMVTEAGVWIAEPEGTIFAYI